MIVNKSGSLSHNWHADEYFQFFSYFHQLLSSIYCHYEKSNVTMSVEGAYHLLVNKTIRLLYLTVSKLPENYGGEGKSLLLQDLRELCSMIVNNPEIYSGAINYKSKNKYEKMDLVEKIISADVDEIIKFLLEWKNGGINDKRV